MAISRVQFTSNTGNAAPTLNATFSSPVTTGNCVLVALDTGSGSTFTNVTDAAGNTYTKLTSTVATNNVGYLSEFWASVNVTGGFTTVTLHFTAGGTVEIAPIEYSGVNSIGQTANISNQGSGNPLSPNLTTTTTGDMLVTQVEGKNIAGFVSNAPWTTFDSQSVWSRADYAPGSIGTFQATFTPTETSTWGSSGVVLTAPTSFSKKRSSMFLVF